MVNVIHVITKTSSLDNISSQSGLRKRLLVLFSSQSCWMYKMLHLLHTRTYHFCSGLFWFICWSFIRSMSQLLERKVVVPDVNAPPTLSLLSWQRMFNLHLSRLIAALCVAIQTSIKAMLADTWVCSWGRLLGYGDYLIAYSTLHSLAPASRPAGTSIRCCIFIYICTYIVFIYLVTCLQVGTIFQRVTAAACRCKF